MCTIYADDPAQLRADILAYEGKKAGERDKAKAKLMTSEEFRRLETLRTMLGGTPSLKREMKNLEKKYDNHPVGEAFK